MSRNVEHTFVSCQTHASLGFRKNAPCFLHKSSLSLYRSESSAVKIKKKYMLPQPATSPINLADWPQPNETVWHMDHKTQAFASQVRFKIPYCAKITTKGLFLTVQCVSSRSASSPLMIQESMLCFFCFVHFQKTSGLKQATLGQRPL